MRELGANKKRQFCLRFRGEKSSVLIEEKVDSKTGYHRGFSRSYLPVMVRGAEGLVNHEVDVELDGFENGWLTGSAVKNDKLPMELVRGTALNA